MSSRILANLLAKRTCLWKTVQYRQAVTLNQVSFLHFKITDKEAGLETQRAANKYKIQLDNNADDFKDDYRITTSTEQPLEITKQNFTQTRQIAFKPFKNELSAVSSEDSDNFGSVETFDEKDEGDVVEEEFLKNPKRGKRLRTIDYARLIKGHLKEKRLKDALAVLEQRMLIEDRAKPETYIFNLLISGCAAAGYTRKAFNLFTKMRQRGLDITGGTYTSLFNACANSPSRNDGLLRANHLREIMLEKGYEPNIKNYNAMIKAYGHCGDVETAYQLADEIKERGLEMTVETFNFLLQACASDKEYGFRHCLLTWHKLLQSGYKPDYFSFKTVLRCVRDCNMGDLQTMQDVIQKILKERESPDWLKLSSGLQNEGKVLQLSEAKSNTNQNENENGNSNVNETDNDNKNNKDIAVSELSTPASMLEVSNNAIDLKMPNLLAPQPQLGSLIGLSEITQAHERFLLLGGINGFLSLMKQYNITPDIYTFTAMLEVIPPTNAAEKQILSFIRKIGLKADIDFFNILIKKRSMRFDYVGAKEVLSMIRTARLQPDIVTYGVLALGCQTSEEARELLQEMEAKGVRMNIQILGAMLRQGCAQKSFQYINEIIQISLDENIKPNEMFLRHLNNFYIHCARAIDARHPSTKSGKFKKQHAKFCDKLRLYQEEQGIAGLKIEDAIKKIKERPYQAYKENDVDGLEPIKNQKYAKQQKLRKYIKKIKLDALHDDDETNETMGIASQRSRQDVQIKALEEPEIIKQQTQRSTRNPFDKY